MSPCGNLYALVVVDDFSRFTWTLFLATKNDTFHDFKGLAKVLENEKSSKIVSIWSDHGGEFQNEKFEHFCEKRGIKHIFQLLELLDKMEWLKQRIDHFKNLLRPC